MKKIIFITLLLFSVVAEAVTPRIVSLAPNITEMLFAAGAGKYVVAVSSFSDYPKKAQTLPVVVMATSVDVESIIALKPTLVVAWRGGTPVSAVKALRANHIAVYWATTNRVQAIAKTVKVLGRLIGTEKIARTRANQFLRRYAALKNKYSRRKTVSIFYQVSHQPLITIGRDSITNELIRGCGGRNILTHTLGAAPEVNMATVLERQPQVIIISQPEHSDAQPFIQAWSKWAELLAVKKKNVFAINSSIIDRPGPRLMQGMALLCKDLQTARQHYNKRVKSKEK